MNSVEDFAWLSLQIAVVTGLVAALQVGLRPWLTPRWRCWLWGLVVLRLVLPVSFSSSWSVFNLLPRSASRSVVPMAPSAVPADRSVPGRTDAPRVQVVPEPIPEPVAVPAGTARSVSSGATKPLTTVAPVDRTTPDPGGFPGSWGLPRLLAAGWLLGALGLLGHMVWGSLRLSRWVSRARPCPDPDIQPMVTETATRLGVRRIPEVRELDGLSSPSLYGFLRPQVLLPPGLVGRLSGRQLRHVLLHELAHVKRRDIALNWVLAVLQAVYWFHPLVWWALARLRADRELACDEIALRAAGPEESAPYGETILRMLSEWSRPVTSPGVVGILEDRRHLRRRILHIAAFRPGRRTGLGLLLGLAVVGLATLTDAQTPGDGAGAPGPSAGTNLPPVVPLRYDYVLVPAEAKDLHSGGNWAGAPKGSNVLGGVHFEIDGLVQLASTSSESNRRGFRPHVYIPVPTNSYGSLHLLAATAWSTENNRAVADVIWRYADGSYKRTPLLYGRHVRDWRRKPFEEPHRVTDKRSKAAVVWSSPDAERAGTVHRMYRVTLANPEPDRKLAAVQFQSGMGAASLMFLAVSLDPLPAGARPDSTRDLEPDDPQWTRHLGVTVIDAGSSNRIGGATVKARVVTTPAAGRQWIERSYTAAGNGVADVLLPETEVESVTLNVSHTDYSETQFNQPVGTNALPPFINVRLHGGIEIGGLILDEARQPVANARVRVYRFWTGNDRPDSPGEQGGFSGKDITTGPDGRWEAAQVPAHVLNRIGISVEHEEHAPAQIQAVDQNETVERALREKRHEIVMETGLWVAGVVVDPTGRPVPDADVRVSRRFFGRTREGKTGADGRFRIGGQKPGETVVSASAKGFGGVAVRATLAADMAEVRLELVPGSLLRGRVLDPEGQPVADVWVSTEQLHQQTSELQDELADFSTRTDATGRWQWDDAPEGEVSFRFSKEGFAQKTRVALRATDQEHVVTLTRPRLVVGTVTDEESGEAVAEFTLEPRGIWWQQDDARTFRNPDGGYEMSLGKEHYDKFQVTSPTHEPREVPIPAAGADVVLRLDIQLRRAESSDGTVVDATGRPVAGAHVVLTSMRSGGVQFRGGRLESYGASPVAVSGPDGRFQLRPQIDPEGVVACTPDGFGFAPMDEYRQTRRVVLEPYGRIEGAYRGRVDPNGRARLNLQFLSASGRPLGIWGQETYQPEVESGGTFTIERVPPGSHQLVRMVPAGDRSWSHAPLQTVEVLPGETTVVEVVVEGATITGRLVLPEGMDRRAFNLGGAISTLSPFKPRPGMTPEELQALVQSPEFQAAMARVRHFPVAVQPDGTFTGEDVPPGDYDLQLLAHRIPGSGEESSNPLFVETRLTVPADAAPGTVIDVGTLSLAAP